MKVFFIGDIVGDIGRKIVKDNLPKIVDRYKVDLVIANGENSAGGFGITQKVAEELFSMGIHILTSGNHIWDKKEAIGYITKENRLLRPANYPPMVPGVGSIVINTHPGEKAAILNLSGRTFMHPIDCPFQVAEKELRELSKEVKVIIVDFHAEATSEKWAMGWFLDGKVSAVIGTHTHVQTADEQILPEGTAYITDVGMTGPVHSIIGIKKEQIIERFLTQMPRRFEIAKGPSLLCGIVIEIDSKTGKTLALQRLQLRD